MLCTPKLFIRFLTLSKAYDWPRIYSSGKYIQLRRSDFFYPVTKKIIEYPQLNPED